MYWQDLNHQPFRHWTTCSTCWAAVVFKSQSCNEHLEDQEQFNEKLIWFWDELKLQQSWYPGSVSDLCPLFFCIYLSLPPSKRMTPPSTVCFFLLGDLFSLTTSSLCCFAWRSAVFFPHRLSKAFTCDLVQIKAHCLIEASWSFYGFGEFPPVALCTNRRNNNPSCDVTRSMLNSWPWNIHCSLLAAGRRLMRLPGRSQHIHNCSFPANCGRESRRPNSFQPIVLFYIFIF